jgi:hypothetical protein
LLGWRRIGGVAAAFAAVATVLVLAGCGGIDQGKLESAIKDQANRQAKAAGQGEPVASVHCAKQQDSYHFLCNLESSSGKTLIQVRATCTKDGHCKWRRA